MLQVKNLGKEFIMHVRGGKRYESISSVSFEVKEREFLGITGPSGIGKSTLLKCIYRTYLPTSGEVWYTKKAGEQINLVQTDDIEILELRRTEIGYISQFLHVIPRVSALDLVAQVLVNRGQERETGLMKARELLERLKIPRSLWEAYPSSFSGGEKQRLNIIRAVIAKPRLLLLDEPTASLDAGIKKEVLSLILELKKEGTAMIGVLHDQESLQILADSRLELHPTTQNERKYA